MGTMDDLLAREARARRNEARAHYHETKDMRGVQGYARHTPPIVTAGSRKALRQHYGVGALELHAEEERIARERGDQDVLARSLFNQGMTLKQRGETERARATFDEALGFARGAGLDSLAVQIEKNLPGNA